MKRVHSFIALIVLAIASMFSVNWVIPTDANSSAKSLYFPEQLLEVNNPDNFPGSNIELNTMLFTETRSSEDGFYYVSRRGMDTVAYFGRSIVKYISGGTTFTLEFPGSRSVIPQVENPTGSVTNYLIGNDPSEWKTGIQDYSVLSYDEVYPGIDLVYKFQDGVMKYEFVVSPYANPDLIRMRYSDAGSVEVKGESITVRRNGFSISDTGLIAMQGDLSEVKSSFQILDSKTIGFNVGPYERTQELIIDPFLNFSTYFGGTGNDLPKGIAVENGYIYITGQTMSTDFPVINAYNETDSISSDVFITKFSPDGLSLIYSTYIGGNGLDGAEDIAVEAEDVYITGVTRSTNFPTVNAYDDTYDGPTGNDGFVTKLDREGKSLVYSTYIGTTGWDSPYAIAVESGFAYIVGFTNNEGFPTFNAENKTFGGGDEGFVTKFSLDGSSLEFSTFLGGEGYDYAKDIAVEGSCAYIVGQTSSDDFPTVSAYRDTLNGIASDVFVTKYTDTGDSLVYSTYLGGSFIDSGAGIAVENGYAYVTGSTSSDDFPTVNAYDDTHNSNSDIFVTKFALDGSSLDYSTYLGGGDGDSGSRIAVKSGYVFVIGDSSSTDFPMQNAINTTKGTTNSDAVIVMLNASSLFFSTYLGGDQIEFSEDIAIDSESIYVTGITQSTNYPTTRAMNPTNNGGQDGFVTKISFYDFDMDGLTNWEELALGTDLYLIDSDNDNFLDAYEVAYGSDPLDPLSYPVMPQAWYDSIYADLDGNATLIQNLITWSDGNASLLETVMQQLENNASLLVQVISWLDGNHTSIETLFTQLDGNATLLLSAVTALDGNSSLIQNLLTWSAGNATLLQNIIDQVNDIEPTDLTQVIAWLDGNHSSIETLFTYVEGNATLLLSTVEALDGNSSLIQNLLTWSNGNETLLLNVIAQVDTMEPTDLTQVIAWLDGNYTAIETLFTYVEGNASLLLNTIADVDYNEEQLDVLAALISGNTAFLNTINATHFDDIQEALDEIRDVLDDLGVSVGDSDYDGLDDLDEIAYGTDLLRIDTDNDNLLDAFEIKLGTDPLDDDSDEDTYLDGLEFLKGTDPLDALSYPGSSDSNFVTTIIIVIGSGGVLVIIVVLIILGKRRT